MSSPEDRPPALPHDTLEAAHEAQLEMYRRMQGAMRTAIAFRLTDFARRVSEAGIRARHPGYDEARLRRALLRLRLGDDAARAVWPGEELVDP